LSKLDLKKSKIELELNQIINKMWEDYELTPNNVEEYKEVKNPQEVQKQVNSLRSDIRALGSINVDSIQEYKEVKERYDFLSEQRYDLEESSNKLRKVIQEMTETMKVQFTEQFKVINKNFGEVFAELFGGGKAELKLVDEDKLERLYNGVYFLPYLTSDGKRVCLYFWNICIHCISICWRNYFFNFCTSKYR
jgi:chromosome segregation protein